ncbi:MAG TPA: hypothetical protein VJM15_01485 [Sphingomicrobium sp.]|nr:hypothetical protein [Sphingomicrobium sp.]
MRSRSALLAAMLLLAAASPGALPPLTVDGWGKIRIGMTEPEVDAALGAKLSGEPVEPDIACVEKGTETLPGFTFMFEEGRLTRISLDSDSKVATPRGIAAGATEEAVRKAYARGLTSEPHTYADPPAEYLTYWTVSGRKGVRFETDEQRIVRTIHAGGASIEYVEGCL